MFPCSHRLTICKPGVSRALSCFTSHSLYVSVYIVSLFFLYPFERLLRCSAREQCNFAPLLIEGHDEYVTSRLVLEKTYLFNIHSLPRYVSSWSYDTRDHRTSS